MPNDPNIQRSIRLAEDSKRSMERNISTVNQQIKLLERQERDTARLPNGDRLRNQLRDQARTLRRSIDKMKQDIRTFERQISDLRRMQR